MRATTVSVMCSFRERIESCPHRTVDVEDDQVVAGATECHANIRVRISLPQLCDLAQVAGGVLAAVATLYLRNERRLSSGSNREDEESAPRSTAPPPVTSPPSEGPIALRADSSLSSSTFQRWNS